MEKLRRFIGSFLAGAALVLAAAVGAVWLGQDHIVKLFVQEANRHLRTPVRVGRVEVSLLDQFPQVSITLHDVRVRGSLPADTVPLAQARRLYCAFGAWDLLRGRYRIRAVTLADGRVRVALDAHGRPNYDVLRPDSSAAAADAPLAFALEHIRLQRVTVTYDDRLRQQRHTVQAQALRARLDLNDQLVDVTAAGDVRVDALQLGADKYLQDKALTLDTRLRIDRAARRIRLEPSELRVGPATYGVAGTVAYGGATELNLTFNGKQTDAQAVLALLPARLTRQLAAYRSRGEVYFGGTVRGTLAGGAYPRVDARFGCRDASFYHPAYRQALERVYLTGEFSNGAGHAARTAVLTLRDVRARLHGRPLSGRLRYENFQNPTVQLAVQADLDVARALQFYPVAAVRQARGAAQLRLELSGNLAEFRRRPATAALQASGELTLRNVQVRLRDLNQPFTGLNGGFLLRRNDVAVTNFAGRLGGSDFRLNGWCKNALGWLLVPEQAVLVEADLAARTLDLDELLRLRAAAGSAVGGSVAGSDAGGYEFRVSPRLALDVDAAVQHVRFRRFRGRQLRGTVRLQQQVLSAPRLSVAAAGGQASFQGTLDARQPQLLHLSSTVRCQQVPLDSLFYVFEDFGQQFITGRHLRGALTATAESDLYFDRALRPLPDRMEAEVNLAVRNGELLNFAPLQKLNMVARREQLRHLRFAQLTTPVYIQSRTVYLPEMEIRSNVRAAALIRVTGTHTFDQQMDYHVSIPLLPGLLPRAAAAGTGPTLQLAIQGNEDNFRVAYDHARAQAARPGARPGPTGAPATGGPAVVSSVRSAASSGAEAAPAAPRKAFELKKPEKKPAQPQTDEYFDF